MARLKQKIVRRVRPLVIIQSGLDVSLPAILPLASEWGWDLLSLSFTEVLQGSVWDFSLKGAARGSFYSLSPCYPE